MSFTHVADGSQFLSCVALFQQCPGVFAGIGAVVVHCEFGAHEVGPDRIHIGDEMFTPLHICQLLAAFLTSESCGVAEAKAPHLKKLRYQQMTVLSSMDTGRSKSMCGFTLVYL